MFFHVRGAVKEVAHQPRYSTAIIYRYLTRIVEDSDAQIES
jgi:predicted transcriptional regulator YheO